MSSLIKYWVSRAAKFRADGHSVYSIASLEPQYKYVAMMTCRLYEREDTSHFYLSWVPLMFRVAEGSSFDWAKILSDSLTSQVTEYQAQKEDRKASSFFMSAYIMDAICFFDTVSLDELELDSSKRRAHTHLSFKIMGKQSCKFRIRNFQLGDGASAYHYFQSPTT